MSNVDFLKIYIKEKLKDFHFKVKDMRYCKKGIVLTEIESLIFDVESFTETFDKNTTLVKDEDKQ